MDQTGDDPSTSNAAGGKTASPAGKVALILSIVVAVATVGMIFLSILDRVAKSPGAPTVPLDGPAKLLGIVYSSVITGAIGFAISYTFYYFAMKQFDPKQYSVKSQLQHLADELSGVDSSAITKANFYANATDRELVSFYRRLQTKPNPQRLAELAFEVRARTGGDERG